MSDTIVSQVEGMQGMPRLHYHPESRREGGREGEEGWRQEGGREGGRE